MSNFEIKSHKYEDEKGEKMRLKNMTLGPFFGTFGGPF